MSQPSPPKATGHKEAGNILFGYITGGKGWCWGQGGSVWVKLLQMGLGHLQATENLLRSFYCFSTPALRIPVRPASHPASSGESCTHRYPPWL